jgi:hypothetical protein
VIEQKHPERRFLQYHSLLSTENMSHLKEGDAAPAFTATIENGSTVNLSEKTGSVLLS